jgi:hypothetical protein
MKTKPVSHLSSLLLDMNNYTFRLEPGDGLFGSIDAFVQENKIEAARVRSMCRIYISRFPMVMAEPSANTLFRVIKFIQ